VSTVIDALVMTLGLDNTLFKKGAAESNEITKKTKENLDKTAKEIEASGKKAASFFNEITSAALRFFGVITAGRGLVDFTRDTIEAGASMERLSQNTGTSVETISSWGRAVEVAGGSQKDFQGDVTKLSAMFTEIKMTGTSAALPVFRMLGVQLADSAGHARKMTDVLMDTSAALQKLPRNEAFNVGKMLGLSEGTLNLLLQGPAAVRAMVDEQRKQGAITETQAKRAQALAQQWTKIKLGLDAIGQNIVARVTPAMLGFFGMLERVGNWFTQHKDIATAFFVGIAIAVAALAAPLVAIIAPLAGIAAEIGMVGAAAAGLRALWDAWMQSSSSATRKWQTVVTETFTAVKAAWALLVAVFTGNSVDITNAWRGAANAFKSLFGGAFSFVKQAWADLVGGIERFFSGNSTVAKWLTGRINAILNRDGATAPSQSAPESKSKSASLPAPVKDDQPALTDTLSPGESDGDVSSTPYNPHEVRSVRNNNPGNLNFAHQGGAVLESGSNARFARFGSMSEGVGALAKQLLRYRDRGLDSLTSIMNRFAPASENNTKAYIANLAKRMHVGADQHLNVADPEVMRALIRGISQYEAGKSYLKDADLNKGLQMAGIGGGGSTTISQSQTTSIGHITVTTQATDAPGIARDLRRQLVAQADSGMR
jgi:hypothetical protein